MMRLSAALLFVAALAWSSTASAVGLMADCAASPQSIATGGTDQTQLAAASYRTNVWVENYCSATTENIAAAESLWVNFGAAAAVGVGFEIAPCGSVTFTNNNYPTTQALHLFAATTAHQFACKANQ